jgi:hypothetical protein
MHALRLSSKKINLECASAYECAWALSVRKLRQLIACLVVDTALMRQDAMPTVHMTCTQSTLARAQGMFRTAQMHCCRHVQAMEGGLTVCLERLALKLRFVSLESCQQAVFAAGTTQDF